MTGRGLRIRAWSATSVGMVRAGNEDSYFHGSTTFAVADGMGGHVAGEVASAAALEPIAELDGAQFPSPSEATAALERAIIAANTTVFEKAAGNPELRGMGTTLTALLVREGCFHLAHVGDSRAYRLRPGEGISRLTTDHTLVQQLIDEHQLKPEHADTHPQRSVITRAIGVERHVDPETLAPEELLPGDQILLCSDGLTGPVKDDEITRILGCYDDGQAACQALIDAANDAGGPDNITVVLLRIDPDPPAGGSRSNGCATDTAEFGSPVPRAEGSGPGSVTQIRTREDHDADFNATKMGRYGEPQGAARASADLRRHKRRLLVRLSGAVALVVVVAACGFLLWSRTYFVGDHSGHVAIFRGVRQAIGGWALSQMVQETDVRTADLPPPLRDQILQYGVPFPNPGDAWQYVNGLLRMQARETQAERKAVEIPRPFASPDGSAPDLPQPEPIPTPTAGPTP